MASLAARRDEIATALTGVSGLRGVDTDGLTPDKLNLPTCYIQVADDSQPMNLTLSDRYEHLDVVLIHSIRGGIRRGQAGLDALYDDVYEAVTSVASVLNVERRGYGVMEYQGVEVLGAILRLEVIDQ